MRKLPFALLGLALLCLTTALSAAAPSAPATAPAAVAASATAPAPDLAFAASLAPPSFNEIATLPAPVDAVNCTPTTTCISCFDEGFTSSYSCTTFCINGVFHRTCGTCGTGCND